jgi:virginiamycin A acetyltransferase
MNEQLTPIKSAILQDMVERLDLVDPAGSINVGKSNVEQNFYAEAPARYSWDKDKHSNVFVGMWTLMEQHTLLGSNVLIGRFCSIGSLNHIRAGRHPMEHPTTAALPERAEDRERDEREKRSSEFLDVSTRKYTVIGNEVWIGVNACLIGDKDLRIGHSACIGAGAVVTKDVPPYAIVVGNPARVIRYRFDPPVIEDLLRLRWWTLPFELTLDLPLSDIAACVERLKETRGA